MQARKRKEWRKEFVQREQAMKRGRTPKINWTESRGQYTATINGKLHHLGTDEKEAQAQFAFLMQQQTGQAEQPADSQITFHEVANRWLAHVEQFHTPRRLLICKSRLAEFTAFIGKSTPARDVNAEQLEAWIVSKGIAEGTQRTYKAVILAALNWAAKPIKVGSPVHSGAALIARNPLKDLNGRALVHLPDISSRGKECVWTEESFQQVFKYANEAFANAVRGLAVMGCRPSLLCQIEAKHYNAKLRLLDVRELFEGKHSRKKYTARVLLSPDAVALVERLAAKNPSGPIFRNSDGTPWSSETLGLYFFQMRNKFKETKVLKWQKGICLYGLRHTFATKYLAKHPDKIEYLVQLFGHKDDKMIRKHYGHLIAESAALSQSLDNFNPFNPFS